MIINTIELENYLGIKIKAKFKKEILNNLDKFVRLKLSLDYGKISEEDYLNKYNSLFFNRCIIFSEVKKQFDKNEIKAFLNPNYFKEDIYNEKELISYIAFLVYNKLYRIQRLVYHTKNGNSVYGLNIFNDIIEKLNLKSYFFIIKNVSSFAPYNRVRLKKNSFIKLIGRKNNINYFNTIYEEIALEKIMKLFDTFDFF